MAHDEYVIRSGERARAAQQRVHPTAHTLGVRGLLQHGHHHSGCECRSAPHAQRVKRDAMSVEKGSEMMNQISIRYHQTEVGEVILGSFLGKLCLLGFRYGKMRRAVDDRIRKGLNAEFVEQDDEILERTRQQLNEYLNGNRREFDIPLLMVGTCFQKSVWNALMKVPHGATSTYLQIAKDIGKGKAVRAVGNANRANPISIIIPCHRIIGSDGKLVGYGGGLSLKKRLLELEQSNTGLCGDQTKISQEIRL